MQGRKWIENVSIAIVPTMAIFFFGGCLLYLILHTDYLLPSLKLIFSSAFAPPSIGGGFAGYTMGKAIRYGTPSFSAPSPDLYLSAISWNFRPNGRRFPPPP